MPNLLLKSNSNRRNIFYTDYFTFRYLKPIYLGQDINKICVILYLLYIASFLKVMYRSFFFFFYTFFSLNNEEIEQLTHESSYCWKLNWNTDLLIPNFWK